MAPKLHGTLIVAGMLGEKGEVVPQAADTARFAGLSAHGQAFLIRVPGATMIAAETGDFPDHIQRLGDPRVMTERAERCPKHLYDRVPKS